jgi:hypothetical protein
MADDGVSHRAQIDTETVKALLFVNGGGAVALLALLPKFFRSPPITSAILVGIGLMVTGLGLAIVHNICRRGCSLMYSQHNFRPPSGQLFGGFGPALNRPTVCFWSLALRTASILCFLVAGFTVAITGWFCIADMPPEIVDSDPG